MKTIIIALLALSFSLSALAQTLEQRTFALAKETEDDLQFYPFLSSVLQAHKGSFKDIKIKEIKGTGVIYSVEKNGDDIEALVRVRGEFQHVYKDSEGNEKSRPLHIDCMVKMLYAENSNSAQYSLAYFDVDTDNELLRVENAKGETLISMKGKNPTLMEKFDIVANSVLKGRDQFVDKVFDGICWLSDSAEKVRDCMGESLEMTKKLFDNPAIKISSVEEGRNFFVALDEFQKHYLGDSLSKFLGHEVDDASRKSETHSPEKAGSAPVQSATTAR